MYDYFIINNTGLCDRHSCRESLIYTYANCFIYTNEKTHFYFGHVISDGGNIDKIKDSYKTLCDTIWKGSIPYEIVQFKDIKDCINSYVKEYQRHYPKTVLIRIPRNVNPPDISLILYLSWFGLTLDLSYSTKIYYIAKKYTEEILNIYPTEGNTINDNLVGGNGPCLYISKLERNQPELYVTLLNLYKSHINEFSYSNSIDTETVYGDMGDKDDEDEEEEDN